MRDRLFCLVILCLTAVLDARVEAQESTAVERVEPPGWWTGFAHRELQILLRGQGLGDHSVSVDYPGVRLTRKVTSDNSNYLFVYLDIAPDAAPGTFDLVLRNPVGAVAATVPYSLAARAEDPAWAEGFTPADAMYLITPDRFANGDPANDSVEGLEDALNRAEPLGRHGGDLAGIAAHLDYIADLGFTALWINPVLENAMPRYSYHGYAITDFYRVDPRFGSNAGYRALADAARERGIKLVMDQVVNHAGSEHWWKDDLPTADWINFENTYVRGSRARTTNVDPYASQRDIRLNADGWFSEGMPDLNQANPLLADYLIQNSIWWIEYLGLGGIRQDTYPHNDKHFMAEWTRRIMTEYPAFNIVGEEWSANPNMTSYWQAGKVNHDGYVSYLPAVFDFPLQDAILRALTQAQPNDGSVWDPVYETLGMDFLYPEPMNLVVFADNHDKSRLFTLLSEDEDLFRMALVFLVTVRGTPQLYYGTEILMANPDSTNHGIIRSDFPGGWAGDRKNAFTGQGLSRREKTAQALVADLFNWRRNARVVHSGRFMHYTPIDDTYVYFRYEDSTDGDAIMVVFNRGDETATLSTAAFMERLSGYRFATDLLTGKRYNLTTELPVEARTAMLLELER